MNASTFPAGVDPAILDVTQGANTRYGSDFFISRAPTQLAALPETRPHTVIALNYWQWSTKPQRDSIGFTSEGFDMLRHLLQHGHVGGPLPRCLLHAFATFDIDITRDALGRHCLARGDSLALFPAGTVESVAPTLYATTGRGL